MCFGVLLVSAAETRSIKTITEHVIKAKTKHVPPSLLGKHPHPQNKSPQDTSNNSDGAPCQQHAIQLSPEPAGASEKDHTQNLPCTQCNRYTSCRDPDETPLKMKCPCPTRQVVDAHTYLAYGCYACATMTHARGYTLNADTYVMQIHTCRNTSRITSSQ
jgi:hypothetical protein